MSKDNDHIVTILTLIFKNSKNLLHNLKFSVISSEYLINHIRNYIFMIKKDEEYVTKIGNL